MSASITRCAAIAVLTASCGNASQPRSVSRDSAGIVIVENVYARPVWEQGSEWRLSSEPQLQIGAVESTGPDQLYGVTDAGLLSDGTLYIVNSRAQEARLFGPRGEHILSIGRRGQGPGEFRSPWEVYELSSGDSLLIVDLYTAVSVFTREGVYARRFVPGNTGGERQGSPIGQFEDGSLLF